MESLTKHELELILTLIQNAHDEEKDNVEVDSSYLEQLETLYDKLKTALIAVNRR